MIESTSVKQAMNIPGDRPKIEDDTDLRTMVYRHGEEGTTAVSRRAAATQPALVMVQGEFPGRVFRLKVGRNTLGRETTCDICIRERAASRLHAEIRWFDAVVLEDLKSTNGTLLNGALISGPVSPLNGNLIKIGSCVLKYIDSLLDVEMLEALHAKGTTDPLTGIYNKANLLLALGSSIEIARGGTSLSLIVLDLDHFKKVNDTHGHLAGDFVLKETCRLVKHALRPEDTFGRFGGEEFIILLPDLDLHEASGVAERIRAAIEQHSFEFAATKIPVTASLGVAEFGGAMKRPDDLITAADERLYQAKREGRNRVVPAHQIH